MFDSTGEEQADAAERSRLQEDLFSLRLNDDTPPSPSSDEEPEVPEGEKEQGLLGGPAELEAGPATVPEPGLEYEPEPEGELRLDGIDEPIVETPVSLPSMEVDFDPAAMDGGVEDDPAESAEAETYAEAPESGPGPIIDDDAELPEDLWIEEGAGFTPRLAAFAVDSAIIAGLLGLFFFCAVLVLGAGGHGWSHIRTPAGRWALFVPFYLLVLFISMCYHTFFPAWTGRTPGKAVMKLDIHRTDGGPMTYTRAFLRWVGYLVSLTFAGLGFLWIFIDERKRGWHDYLSGTWVKNLRDEHPEDV